MYLGDPGFQLFEIGRCTHALDPQAGAGLVDQVDCLVRQVAVGNVSIGKVGGSHQGLICDGDSVVSLVFVTNAAQNLDRVRHCWFFDLDRLETTLERGVFLQVLAVFLGRGGTDGLQLAAGQHWLENRGSVDCALSGSSANQGVNLVDEQHDVAAGLDLFEYLLQPLFEIAAIAATGDQCTQVQGVQLLVAQCVGDVVGDDLLCQTFDDGGLANARFANEHRVVLGAAAENLHHSFQFAGSADDGVELLLASQLGQVAPKLIKDLAVAFVGGVFFTCRAGAGPLAAACGSPGLPWPP